MDNQDESAVGGPFHSLAGVDLKSPPAPPADAFHANETVSRWVAYASQYVFWMTVACIGVGIALLQ